MSSAYPCSVVLAAHGSLAWPNANQPLFDLADQLEQTKLFSQVTPAFFNGTPQTANVLDLLPHGDIVVVPVMTSDGYYAKNVLPSKLAENRDLKNRRVFVTPALGTHANIAEFVSQRIVLIALTAKLDSANATFVVIGHGTTRNPDSCKSTFNLTQQLSELHPELQFETAFLDQEPTVQQIADRVQTSNKIIIPFLISRGPHTIEDVPQAFGLTATPDSEFPLIQRAETGITLCDLPIGMYPQMADLCVEFIVDKLLDGTPIQFQSSLTNL